MRKRRLIVAAALLAVLVAVAAAVAYGYDRSRADRIADGVRVAGIDLGGLSEAQARARLERRLVARLREPVVVEHGRQRFELTAREAGLAVNLDGIVERALARSREGSFLTRVARELTGGRVEADLAPRVAYSRQAVRGFAADVAARLDRDPKDASVAFTASSLTTVPGRAGLHVQERRLRRSVVRALTSASGQRTVAPRVRRLQPQVTKDELADRYATVITVDRGNFQLRLWKRLKLVKTYRIAVGAAGLETPAGLYAIQNKAVDPVWHVPESDWAGDLAGKEIPPGPQNPIKARWMGIYDGAGIHGTDAISSLGTAASHGCIRMAVPDVIDLYDRTPVGASVYIA